MFYQTWFSWSPAPEFLAMFWKVLLTMLGSSWYWAVSDLTSWELWPEEELSKLIIGPWNSKYNERSKLLIKGRRQSPQTCVSGVYWALGNFLHISAFINIFKASVSKRYKNFLNWRPISVRHYLQFILESVANQTGDEEHHHHNHDQCHHQVLCCPLIRLQFLCLH